MGCDGAGRDEDRQVCMAVRRNVDRPTTAATRQRSASGLKRSNATAADPASAITASSTGAGAGANRAASSASTPIPSTHGRWPVNASRPGLATRRPGGVHQSKSGERGRRHQGR